MTHFPHINFSRVDRPQSDWSSRVAAHLDALDAPVTPADLALVEAAALGRQFTHTDRMRVAELMRPTRDAYGRVTLDGQQALLAVVRAKTITCVIGGSSPA